MRQENKVSSGLGGPCALKGEVRSGRRCWELRNSGNMGLFNHGLHSQLISWGYHRQNKSESNGREPVAAGVGEPVPGLGHRDMLVVPAGHRLLSEHSRDAR